MRKTRLVFAIVLSCVPGHFMLLAGVLCSSMVAINMGTSRRSYLNAMGNEAAPSVAYSNNLAARVLLEIENVCAPHLGNN